MNGSKKKKIVEIVSTVKIAEKVNIFKIVKTKFNLENEVFHFCKSIFVGGWL